MMNQPVTVTFVPEQIVTWLFIGLLAGYLASVLVRGRKMSIGGSIIVGLVGALIGGLIFTLLQIQVPAALSAGITIRYIDILVSFIGAVIVLALVQTLFWRRL
jgi:uncharacterized membrane protein YeaQ/YmgE (transglycosylase-associated protein family)